MGVRCSRTLARKPSPPRILSRAKATSARHMLLEVLLSLFTAASHGLLLEPICCDTYAELRVSVVL